MDGTAPADPGNRFATIDDDQVQELLDGCVKNAKSTQRSTRCAVKTFKAYLKSKNMNENFEDLTNEELDRILCKFYVEVRQENGQKYQKTSFYCLRYGLQRHLSVTKNIDIIKDAAFAKSKKLFEAAVVALKRDGKGRIEHLPPIEDHDIKKMYDYFDLTDNVQLQQKVFVDILLYFGRRGRVNLTDLRVNDFATATDADGKLFLYLTKDEQTKNHQVDPNSAQGRMYARSDDPRCPVKSFMRYKNKLNPKCDRLFQRPVKSENSISWYANQPLGHNTLGGMMSLISEKAGLSKRYTNHSLRSTTVSILHVDSHEFPSHHIASVNGHDSETSLKTYTGYTAPAIKRKMSENISNTLRLKIQRENLMESDNDSVENESELQMSRRPSSSDDSSDNQQAVGYSISLQQCQQELQLKEQMLQATKQKVEQLELFQSEYKRLLQESTILQQHLDTSRTKNKELLDKIEKMKKAKQNVDDSWNKSSFEQMCYNKFLFRHYTGYMPEEFQILFQFLITDGGNEPFKGTGHSLSLRTQLLLTLYKLRNNFTFIDLGQRFNVLTITAKNIFLSWLNHMSKKFEEVYVWPHRNTLRAQVPRHFQQDFPNTIALFKSVKIKISHSGKDKNDRQEASKKSSNVRHGILVVSPRGCVIGCSGLVSGTVTDSDLFQKSGLKNELIKYLESGRLQAGDGMISENLDIGQDLGELGLKLNDVAFSKCDIDDDLKAILQKQRVQTHKVVVDKTICRLRNFKIMSQIIPSCLSASCDKIFQVTAFLTNFLPPLLFDV